MKTYYTDYVNHCIRLYVRYPVPNVNSKAEIDNWNACKRACNALTEDEKELVKEIYSNTDSIAYSVDYEARRRRLKSSYVWDVIKKLEKQVAIERGLI